MTSKRRKKKKKRKMKKRRPRQKRRKRKKRRERWKQKIINSNLKPQKVPWLQHRRLRLRCC